MESKNATKLIHKRFKGDKTMSKNEIITIIISIIASIISLLSMLISWQDHNDNKKNAETEKMIQSANNGFLSVTEIEDYKIIFNKYKKIQERKPNDNTGCEKFLDKVESMLERGQCGENTKKLLQFAKDLNSIENNIRLINYEKICNDQ
jgi:hypothetical protein